MKRIEKKELKDKISTLKVKIATDTNNMTKTKNLGELKKSGYKSKSIKDELRDNLIDKIKIKKPLLKEFMDMKILLFQS